MQCGGKLKYLGKTPHGQGYKGHQKSPFKPRALCDIYVVTFS